MTKSPPRTDAAVSWPALALNVVRGALIGTAETVPGVSGGTVALVVRVYDSVITSAGHLLSGVAKTVTGRGRARAAEEFRQVHWRVVLPLLVGMVAAVLLVASVMEGLVADYPVQMRALFFGLVLASLWVPFSLAAQAPSADATGRDGWRPRDWTVGVVAAVLTAVVVSLPPGDVGSNSLVVLLSAMVAVSALVLPGLSGSFILLTIGLYEPTLSAINDRDLGYLGVFALGALVGLASIVKVLQWLLEHRQRVTLVVLTGLLTGSLRALWPWQDDERSLLAPAEHVGMSVTLAALGFAVVAGFLVADRKLRAD
ncbi:DUF368 domain-containing protein [Saccharomonospora saliphila]|uniref:DUF368 domain-containing protein n=1 Tax=Saccharomonospora saliphila TaxID=369829 RepID=UPI000378D703|nr:DUF368 domain-containing protein [Saccharomonospora saliphila]